MAPPVASAATGLIDRTEGDEMLSAWILEQIPLPDDGAPELDDEAAFQKFVKSHFRVFSPDIQQRRWAEYCGSGEGDVGPDSVVSSSRTARTAATISLGRAGRHDAAQAAAGTRPADARRSGVRGLVLR